LKIRSLAVTNHEGEVAAELNNANRAYIEISFDVLQEGRGYDIGIQLNMLQYGVIFGSSIKDVDNLSNDSKIWHKGSYTYQIELPMSILRGGDYWVTAASVFLRWKCWIPISLKRSSFFMIQ